MRLPINYDTSDIATRRAARQEYVRLQKGKCYHCHGDLHRHPPKWLTDTPINWRLFPGGKEGFLRYPHHLHHSHDTGLTIGTVHAYCNAVLWQHHGE